MNICADVQTCDDVNQGKPCDPSRPKEMQRRASRAELRSTANALRNGAGNARSLEMLIQDLEIHQIELQTQNEELRRSQIETEEARRKYSDLYDFAPIGYFTLNAQGSDSRSQPDGCSSAGSEPAGTHSARAQALCETGGSEKILNFCRRF